MWQLESLIRKETKFFRKSHLGLKKWQNLNLVTLRKLLSCSARGMNGSTLDFFVNKSRLSLPLSSAQLRSLRSVSVYLLLLKRYQKCTILAKCTFKHEALFYKCDVFWNFLAKMSQRCLVTLNICKYWKCRKISKIQNYCHLSNCNL